MYIRDDVLKDLRNYIVEVTFRKVDGSQRVMRCTIQPDYMPPSYLQEQEKENSFHKENPNVIAAWDIEKGGWRSFRVDSVEYLQIIDSGY